MTPDIDHDWWRYENLPSGEPYRWHPAERGASEYDNIDFHVDFGCGRLKKGRLGLDRFPDPGVDIPIDLETMLIDSEAMPWERFMGLPFEHTKRAAEANLPSELLRKGQLPFPDNSIHSAVSHHMVEHLDGFIYFMDEVYRVLAPGAIFRIITPLFPSHSAVADPDHKRWFCEGTFESFCGTPDNCWLESFSTPYTSARFTLVDKDMTPPTAPEKMWTQEDAREIRVALRK